jgi:prepilin-type N-terminal cleavage/methylation domain-containing protein
MFTSRHLRPQPRRFNRAFTLVELSLALAVSGLILASTLSFSVYASKSFAAIHNYVDLEQRSQVAIDSMLRDIRETQFLLSYSTATLPNGNTITNVLTFRDSDGTNMTFNFTNNVLLKTKGPETKMLLTNVDFLTFQMFKRVPVGGTFDQFPTGTPTNCKLVSVSWICSRTIIGSKLNTESVQTAKIVIRKQ